MGKILDKFKNKYFLFSFVAVMFSVVCLVSYGIFVVTTDKYRASEMYFGNLLYQISLSSATTDTATVDGKVVTLTSDNATSTIFMTVTSLNPVKSRYNVQYQVTSGTASVRYSNVTGWMPQGYLDSSDGLVYQKTIKINIINASGSAATVALDVAGGYAYNSDTNIATLSGYTKLVNNDSSSYFDDSSASSVKVLSTRIKNDTECTPTASIPCIYGGEMSRNYVSYSGDIYRIIGLYLIDEVESVKLVKATNYATDTTYNTHQTTFETWESALSLSEEYVKTSSPFCTTDTLTCTSPVFDYGLITKTEYEAIGAHYSYINNSTNSLTTTEENGNVYYIKSDGTLGTTAKTTTMSARPVLYLQDGVKVLKTTNGTSASPYQLAPRGDIFINSITVDGVVTGASPTTGHYIMESNCTCDQETCGSDTSISWDMQNHTIDYTLGENSPTVVCDLEFFEIDTYFSSITIEGVAATAAPTESGYAMTATCTGGTAVWNDDTHKVETTIAQAPLICSLAFREIIRLYAYNGTLSTNSMELNANSSGTATLTAATNYTTVGTGIKCTTGITGSISGSTVTIASSSVTKGICQIVAGREFSYTGAEQTYTVPVSGTYKLQVWGAQGGNYSTNYPGGKGGYSIGIATLTGNDTLSIYVGGQGTSVSGSLTAGAGGYNGGASGGQGSSNTYGYGGSGGGGATDIRRNGTDFSSRIIIAGGGGGSGGPGSGGSTALNASTSGSGGAAGGTTGVTGTKATGTSYCGLGGIGGSTTGGSGGAVTSSSTSSTDDTYYSGGGGGGGGGYYGGGGGGGGSLSRSTRKGSVGLAGELGLGGAGGASYPSGASAYYGGGGGGGGGGSSYITGLSNASTYAGNVSFTSISGGTETGHAGNGYAIITFVP